MTDSTTDRNVILPQELLESFGTTSPSGNKQINSTRTSRASMETLYCTGDAYMYGNVKTALKVAKGILAADGTETTPAFAFTGAPTLGLYRNPTRGLTFTDGGISAMSVSAAAVEINVPITTASGNLVLNPAGASIDMTGHTLINVAGAVLSTGPPNEVLINDGTGHMSSEPLLATSRGGTGINSAAASGFAKVTAGTWAVGPISGDDLGNLTTLTADQITTSTINSAGTLTVTAPVIFTGDEHQIPSGVIGGDSATYAVNIGTLDATAATLFTLPTSSGTNGATYTIRAIISLADVTGGANTGSYDFVAKCKNLLGSITVSNFVQQSSMLDGALVGTSITSAVVGSNVTIVVHGLAATHIIWIGRFDVLSQLF